MDDGRGSIPKATSSYSRPGSPRFGQAMCGISLARDARRVGLILALASQGLSAVIEPASDGFGFRDTRPSNLRMIDGIRQFSQALSVQFPKHCNCGWQL